MLFGAPKRERWVAQRRWKKLSVWAHPELLWLRVSPPYGIACAKGRRAGCPHRWVLTQAAPRAPIEASKKAEIPKCSP